MIRRDFTRLQGKSYAGPRLRNPFFDRTPSRLTKIVVLGGLIIVPIAALSVLLYAPFMQYGDVRIEGLTTLTIDEVKVFTEEQLHRRIAFVLPGTNIVLARREAIADALRERFSFQEVAVTGTGRTIVVTAKERISEVAWMTGGATYLLDLHGNAVREASAEALAMLQARLAQAADVPSASGIQPTMPILLDESGAAVEVGTMVANEEVLGDILALDELLRTRAMWPVRYRFSTVATPWVSVDLTNGVSLLLDLQSGEPDVSMRYLDAYLAEQQPDLAQIASIDLRFENHLYIKHR